MSNSLAVATVTAALQVLLTDTVEQAVSGATVWTDRSDVPRQTAGVNIYLYRTSDDPARRNDDLPTRGADGAMRTRPCLAGRLHYLLTFHGKDDELEPQRLLGATLARLHSRPIVTRALIDQVVAEATDPTPRNEFLGKTDLAAADELVRLTPEPLDLDELSKLWSVFFQTAYQLSATYVASPVLLEERDDVAVPAPPVLAEQLTVRGVLRPTITGVRNSAGARDPIVADSELVVEGSGLRGEQTSIRVGAAELTPTAVSPTQLTLDLGADAGLRAGLQPVLVAHRWLVGDLAEPRGGETSNVAGVLLQPRITASFGGGELTVTSDLVIGAHQTVTVRLLSPSTGQTVLTVDVPARSIDSATVSAPLTLPSGQYAVVLQVDGAESPVSPATGLPITAPVVTI
ncbi:DUF4255 domain-containing protein [Kribbella sp. NBC_00709]|uniref:DUF4255 domain-containing protein n=1 Tax=Kribbella sp. NBC_00709 TaxID=2975972 RepID=UPI002E2DD252|nr:DUF4255 domain-containing protein [Kribbella sp. NBC_00709]